MVGLPSRAGLRIFGANRGPLSSPFNAKVGFQDG